MISTFVFITTYISGILAGLRVGTFYLFITYQLVYFLSPQLRWWGENLPALPYSKILVLIMISSFLIRSKKTLNNIWSSPHIVWLYLILLTLAITSFYAIWLEIHIASLIDFFKLVLIITIAYAVINENYKLRASIWAYCTGCSYIGLLAFQTGRNEFGRVHGIGTVDAPDANGIAAAIAPSIIFYSYLLLSTQSRKIKLLIIPLGALVVNGLILMNSRGAFLAIVCGSLYFLYFLYFSQLKRKFQNLKISCLLIIGLSGTFYLVDHSFIERINTMKEIEINNERETGATRFIFWRSAIEMSFDYPLGKGTRAFDIYAPTYLPENVNTGSQRNRSVHSSWMEVLTEIGFLGAFFFVMLLIASIKTGSIVRNHARAKGDWELFYRSVAISAALICFIVTMTFLNRYRAEVLYWLVLFSACNYAIYKKNTT